MKNKSTTLQGVITFFMMASVVALVITTNSNSNKLMREPFSIFIQTSSTRILALTYIYIFR